MAFDALATQEARTSDSKLLHSPRLVAIGLSEGYETWPPIGRHHAFVIVWSKYRLGLPSAPLHYGLTWSVGIPTVFQTPVTVPLHSPTAGNCLPLGLCKGTVKESREVRKDQWAPDIARSFFCTIVSTDGWAFGVSSKFYQRSETRRLYRAHAVIRCLMRVQKSFQRCP